MEAGLPNDVFLLVGEQLEQHTDRRNLILVSRHFHGLFLPLIYQVVHLHSWRDAKSFLYAITKRPSLANAVRELNLAGWQPEFITEAEQPELHKSGFVRERVEESSYSTEEMTQWHDDLSKGLGDAWIALVLPLLGQLRRLRLDYSTQTPFLERTMQRAINCERPFFSKPAFEHLREVSLHHRMDVDCLGTQEHTDNNPTCFGSTLLLSFFQLPSVRSIVANSVVEPRSTDAGEENPENPPAGSSSITDIDLRASCGNQGMEMLVASCAELKSFKYQHSDSHVLSHGYRPAAFYRSLVRSKDSLHTLWLDQYGDHYPFTAAGLNQTHDEWFGSLAEFIALRDLRIRLPNLLNIRYQNEPSMPLVQCLPPSLERLFIESCEERHMTMLIAQLRMLIRNRHSRVPNLQFVGIEGTFRDAASDEFGETSDPPFEPLDNSVKSKIMQVAEPLHVDCVTAGIHLHLHDRVFVEKLH